MRTTKIGDCNFMSGSCTSVPKGKIFKTRVLDQMKSHLNLIIQLIGIIICTGLTKTQKSDIRQSSRSTGMVWSVFQRINWAVRFGRDCHGLDICKCWKSWFHILMLSLRIKMRFTSNKTDYTSLSCQFEEFSRSHIQSELDRMNCYRVPASISRLNPSSLLPLGNLREHGVRHNTTNTGGTERSNWTRHLWYSISKTPDGMSLYWTSLLGKYCGRRWTFWICAGLGKFKE